MAADQTSNISTSTPRDLCADDGRIYMAVLNLLQYEEANLEWVLHSTPPGGTLVFLYVMSKRSLYLTSQPKFRDKKDMDKVLGDYTYFCKSKKIKTERLVIHMDDIVEGLVRLILKHKLSKLVMDAGEDWYYERCSKMLSSQIAIDVIKVAPASCKIWFICHGNLVYTREATMELEMIDHGGTTEGLQEPTEQPRTSTEEYDIPIASYAELVAATSNFTAPVLGKGGYGEVYKADLWGTEVAIKMLFGEDDLLKKSFEKEVYILGRLSHPNLVRVVGACREKFAIIYEYMPGGNLEDRLVKKDLTWQEQLRIVVEVSKALKFLHSPKPDVVIHGDIKPANILLDENGSSRLGDFGLCRRILLSTTRTHHSTRSTPGTPAYLDPKFIQNGEMSPKIDIYAFGMVLLRLLTGQGNINTVLPFEVDQALKDERLNDMLDVEVSWPAEIAEKLVKLALRCCDIRKVQNRPDAGKILEELEQIRKECSV